MLSLLVRGVPGAALHRGKPGLLVGWDQDRRGTKFPDWSQAGKLPPNCDVRNTVTSSVRAVVGLDVGGTSSTVVVLAEHGEVLGRATGPGGNFRSSPGAVTANLGAALSEATDAASTALGSRAWAVEALTAGIAGAGPAGRDRAATVL
ncbi:hypothetical protein GB881_17015, partial [Georgenia subflava]|nr:hypothetical protein [Georgenia subflava]